MECMRNVLPRAATQYRLGCLPPGARLHGDRPCRELQRTGPANARLRARALNERRGYPDDHAEQMAISVPPGPRRARGGASACS